MTTKLALALQGKRHCIIVKSLNIKSQCLNSTILLSQLEMHFSQERSYRKLLVGEQTQFANKRASFEPNLPTNRTLFEFYQQQNADQRY